LNQEIVLSEKQFKEKELFSKQVSSVLQVTIQLHKHLEEGRRREQADVVHDAVKSWN